MLARSATLVSLLFWAAAAGEAATVEPADSVSGYLGMRVVLDSDDLSDAP